MPRIFFISDGEPVSCLRAGLSACFLFLLSVLQSGCSSAQNQQPLKEYALDKPEKFFMPESLLEISGIAFYRGNPDTVYAIQDEEGKLFRLRWMEKKQYHSKFAKRGDYEDLAILGDQVFVLKSNGHLYAFPLSEADYEEVEQVREWKEILPPGEYEGLFADEQTGQLYVLCKHCEAGGKDRVPGYIFQTGDSLKQVGSFVLDMRAQRPITGKAKDSFRPSALAKNPVTGEWFILSAVNSMLVITDAQWKVKTTVHLNQNEFNQPEGIAFDTRGNLYISNEGGDLTEGNILRFTRRSK
ncbi:MAG TPA: SdiA-regulated domain-containing protein [Puia sp.]|nr:SdiA-regulated domain-containing protein [Puia sp.]